MVKLPKSVRFAILSLIAASMVIAFSTPIGNDPQLAYAAKSGNTNSYCYPNEIGGLGTEFSCSTNMGDCHKAQAVDQSASGECIILRSLDGELG